MTDHEKLRELFKKRMDGTLDPPEEGELDDLLSTYSDEELSQVLEEVFSEVTDIDESYYNHDWEAVRRKIVALHPAAINPPYPPLQGGDENRSTSRLRSHHKSFIRYAAAAVLLFAVAGGVWYFLRPSATVIIQDTGHRPVQSVQSAESVVTCGLVEPTQKEREKDNRLIHLSIHNGIETLSISPGWQFHTTLPDGSEVVLNAASSVTYPGSFKGLAKREVEVKGEVFFDVAQKAHQPFFVKVKGIELQALGTSFNVNAYGDKDSVYTTLVSGSLKAVKGGSSALLRPGQQAAIALKDTASIQVGTANLAATGMWREGYFSFNQSRVDEVMQELSRWYKWDIRYSSSSRSSSFSGTFCRRTSEADVLETLKAGGIHFQKTGNHITIQ